MGFFVNFSETYIPLKWFKTTAGWTADKPLTRTFSSRFTHWSMGCLCVVNEVTDKHPNVISSAVRAVSSFWRLLHNITLVPATPEGHVQDSKSLAFSLQTMFTHCLNRWETATSLKKHSQYIVHFRSILLNVRFFSPHYVATWSPQ